jgi:Mrp family chromosome partitioning ATPase
MVVAADGTPQDVARKAKQQFKDSSLIGVVLNRAAVSNRYGSYYYGAYGARQESPTTRV